jgi:4-hydroxybenzoate polyprenyltransferase
MQPNKQPPKITFWGTLGLMLKEFLLSIKKQMFSEHWQDRIEQYGLLMRVDKPIGFFLLLWPTLWAIFLASEGTPNFGLLFIFALGVFLMRSAGCVINDYADRKIDGKVARTKDRPMATGKVSEKEALIVFIVLALLAFCLVLALNLTAIILSFIALAIATAYPFMKRVTYFPQVVLGAAFSMAIPMAYVATNNKLPNISWLIYIANLLWVLAYDTLYAMVDKEDDIKAGVKSTAILFGEAELQLIAIIQGFFIFGMLLVGIHYELNYWYYLGLITAALFITWQLWHCRNRQRENCFEAFLNNNWVGFFIFLGILLSTGSG